MKNVLHELTHIVQSVALVESPHEQIQLIVSSISHVIEIDVCTIYRVETNGDLLLIASHGLDSEGVVRIPAGKGLVGLVVKNRHPVNVANAAGEADYYFVKASNEAALKSFCGVPLVRHGQTMGVLAVQSTKGRKLSKDKEAFLATLALQLAMLLPDISIDETLKDNQHIKGVKGASGVGIGNARFLVTAGLANVADAPCEDVDADIARWHELLAQVQSEIVAEQSGLSDEVSNQVASIFDAYQMLLADPALSQRVEAEIQAGHWLPGALKISIHFFADIFRNMEDPYLRARYEDILHLGEKLYQSWQGVTKGAISTEDGPVVLIGAQVSVSDIASIPPEQLAGVVCLEGASLSHTAVVANALGIPAVMGVGALKGVVNGDVLIVDGNEAQVIARPSELLLNEYKKSIAKESQLTDELGALRDEPAETRDGQKVRLLANTGLLADITPGVKSGAEGVGLYRTELTFMARDSFPNEDEQVEVYRQVFQAYPGKPIYMRTLDVGGDKQLTYFPILNEENPALGWRGIRFCTDNIPLLMTQVRAMIRASVGSENLHVLLPMVSATSQIDTFRELLNDACQQLDKEGVKFSIPKVGIMVEVPAVISQLPFWKHKIDFVSVGSNDLSQYMLAIDRNNVRVADLFDHLHPAILHELQRAISTAKDCGLPLSVCGEMASDPAAVVLLVGMGVRTLSMSAAKLPRIKAVIRSLEYGQAESLLGEALGLDDAKLIRQMVTQRMAKAGITYS